jgi:hypothetical protein
MAVADDHVAALRAMIVGDFDQFAWHRQRVEQANGLADLNVILAAAFTRAVRRKFKDPFAMADVIQFVASERVRVDDRESDFDPLVAERLVLAALGYGSPEGLDEDAAGFAQAALLVALIPDENLDDAGLNDFLAEARKLADSIAQA